MSSECRCHKNQWCFYCEMYVPLERTLAERDAEIQTLKQRLADFEGCKGVEDYYAVLCKSREQQQEIQRLKIENEELTRWGKSVHQQVVGISRLITGIDTALSHQTEQPETNPAPKGEDSK